MCSLSKWASIAEIVGAAGVIISLIFVVKCISKNMAALETNAATDFLDAWRNMQSSTTDIYDHNQ